MDALSLYYFSELAKDLHMTRTAARLFISQQILSNFKLPFCMLYYQNRAFKSKRRHTGRYFYDLVPVYWGTGEKTRLKITFELFHAKRLVINSPHGGQNSVQMVILMLQQF